MPEQTPKSPEKPFDWHQSAKRLGIATSIAWVLSLLGFILVKNAGSNSGILAILVLPVFILAVSLLFVDIFVAITYFKQKSKPTK